MTITIKSTKDLECLLDTLSRDILDAIHYQKLYEGINSEIANFPSVFSQSNTFWQLTTKSLSDSALHALCRVFDTKDSSLSLPNLLRLIAENIHYFSEEHFRERMKGNAFIDGLADINRIPDLGQLRGDVERCSPSNSLVQKLLIWRNNVYAHRGAKSTLTSNRVLASQSITWAEVEQLSDLAMTTYNHYLSMFKAASWSTTLIGQDDYKSLLRFAQMGINQYRHNNEMEMAKYHPDLPSGTA